MYGRTDLSLMQVFDRDQEETDTDQMEAGLRFASISVDLCPRHLRVTRR